MKTLTTAAATVALIGSIGGGVYGLEARYVPQSEYRDFQWAYLKRDLREMEKELERIRTEGQRDARLEDQYRELLELFCRKYPEDRDCR